LEDVLHGPDWRELLVDFDKKLPSVHFVWHWPSTTSLFVFALTILTLLCVDATHSCLRFDRAVVQQQLQLAASPKPQKEAVDLGPAWQEPTTLQGVLDRYNVEAKIPSKCAGATLFLVSAMDRQGKSEAKRQASLSKNNLETISHRNQ